MGEDKPSALENAGQRVSDAGAGANVGIEDAARELLSMDPAARQQMLDTYNQNNDLGNLPDAKIENKDGQQFLVFSDPEARAEASLDEHHVAAEINEPLHKLDDGDLHKLDQGAQGDQNLHRLENTQPGPPADVGRGSAEGR